MNKKSNRKGFTIVELVIVIAVIAILATVLVPTFGDVISNANKAAAQQEARNLYTQYVSKTATTAAPVDTVYYTDAENGIIVKVDNGSATVVDAAPADAHYVIDAEAEVKCSCNGQSATACTNCGVTKP